jgi:hypothetical protein
MHSEDTIPDDRDSAGRFVTGRQGKAGPGRPKGSVRSDAMRRSRERIEQHADAIIDRALETALTGRGNSSVLVALMKTLVGAAKEVRPTTCILVIQVYACGETLGDRLGRLSIVINPSCSNSTSARHFAERFTPSTARLDSAKGAPPRFQF